MTFLRNMLASLALVAMATTSIQVHGASSDWPATRRIVYDVRLGERQVGQLAVTLSQDASGRHVEALTRPEGVARLLLDEVTESFAYQMKDWGWQPMSYRETNGNEVVEVTFSAANQLVASSAETTSRHALNSLVEPQAFPLSVMLLPADQLAERPILVPTKRGIREYHYERLGEETIVAGGREFSTLKWLKQRKDKTDRGFHVWSDTDTNLPVRVEKFKKNSTMIMELSTESAASM